MGRFAPVFRRELGSYFSSPVAYVILTIFLVISGYFFYNILAFYNLLSFQAIRSPMLASQLNLTEAAVRPFFLNLSIVLVFLIPSLTMRLLAEERKSGTVELLFTYPFRDLDILLGKALACIAVFGIMLGISLVHPLLLTAVARPEPGPLLTGYLGLILAGVTFIFIGLLISSFTENQIVAYLITFAVLLLFWAAGWPSEMVGGTLGKLLAYFSLSAHFDSFAKGVIDTRDLTYFGVLIAFSIFLTLRSLESKKWRG